MCDYISKVNTQPLDHALFLDLARVAIEALEGRRREIPPDAERCLEDYPPETVYLTDAPMNQFGMSIITECNRRFGKTEAEATALSFLFRWFAMQEAIRSGRVAQFTRRSGGTLEVHSAVFAASSACGLDSSGKFDKTYESRIRQFWSSNGDPAETL